MAMAGLPERRGRWVTDSEGWSTYVWEVGRAAGAGKGQMWEGHCRWLHPSEPDTICLGIGLSF